ncbi:Virulence protein [Oligella ureolytica]|uniref:Virulence RhuM family protein n=1 Tax=Oligella ureolytica TaxID=90244 RepID=A0A378XHB4_9BURK|nr:virulence RhuM family protein [Oligella ureolytica]SUA56849.1 Virulence protein [Oligella ureolytica]
MFDERELVRSATVSKNATVQLEVRREVESLVKYYNPDIIISIGYRVKYLHDTQFRIWATEWPRIYLQRHCAG